MDWKAYAHQLAGNSLDPSTKVGAVIVSGGYAVGIGWNHFPAGIPEEWWEDREKKYQGVIHAETIAITRAGLLSYGSTLVVTHHPCKECAKLIVAAGIRCVICPQVPWRDDPGVIDTVKQAREILELCGVDLMEARATQ